MFFMIFWALLIIGFAVNVFLDRHPDRGTRPRVVELALLWLLVFGGAWGLIGVFSHTGPMSAETAASIGYAPSMFQWEVGFGDLTLSVLGIASFWFRDRWLTAAVVATAIALGGDGVGHIMQMVDGNMAVNNVWSMPSDFLQAALGVLLLIAYRKGRGRLPQLPKHGVVGDTEVRTLTT